MYSANCHNKIWYEKVRNYKKWDLEMGSRHSQSASPPPPTFKWIMLKTVVYDIEWILSSCTFLWNLKTIPAPPCTPSHSPTVANWSTPDCSTTTGCPQRKSCYSCARDPSIRIPLRIPRGQCPMCCSGAARDLEVWPVVRRFHRRRLRRKGGICWIKNIAIK